ncbi:MAG: flagellar hook-basal body complex protein FliE [Candidatus Cloacimonadota bacterium]|nr:flagellar hook-basal body complex protein FliE [Candidatus Cloacimonadota bacterium]
MNDPRINGMSQLRQMAKASAQNLDSKEKNPSEISFKETMKKYLEDANDLQLEADDKIKMMIAGEDIDPHSVMLAAEKASISFSLVMEIKNKMLEAYRDIMKTQV